MRCYSDIYFCKVYHQKQPPEVFCKKGFLWNFAKFTRKHLCQSLFINKIAGLRPATLLKKRLWRSVFPVNFVKFLRTPLLIEHLWYLLPYHVFTSKHTSQTYVQQQSVNVINSSRALRLFFNENKD